MSKTYDVKCYELAEHFLQDHPEINTVDRCRDLAGEIQEAVESWLSMEEWLHKKRLARDHQGTTGGNRD